MRKATFPHWLRVIGVSATDYRFISHVDNREVAHIATHFMIKICLANQLLDPQISPLGELTIELKSTPLEVPLEVNIILDQTHFIKTVEDLHEIMVGTVSHAKYLPVLWG